MTTKKFHVVPYRLRTAERAPSVRDILNAVFALTPADFVRGQVPPDANRWGEHEGTYLQLDDLVESPSQIFVGSVLQLRVNDLDAIGDHNGIIPGSGGMTAKQGHARHVVFLYDEPQGLLWFQADRRGAGFTAFKDYLRRKSGMAFGHVGVYDTDALARAIKYKHFKEFGVTLHDLPDVQSPALKAAGDFDNIDEIRKRYGAAKIEIRLVPERGGGLGARIAQMVKEIAGLSDDDNLEGIASAWVDGSEQADEETEVLDLIRDRTSFETEIQVARYTDVARLKLAVKEIWNDHKYEIPA